MPTGTGGICGGGPPAWPHPARATVTIGTAKTTRRRHPSRPGESNIGLFMNARTIEALHVGNQASYDIRPGKVLR
jgi:hypothetical protein